MNRRLQQFLELEQLKPAQFADIMGIQRSNVSHILSGRNKPGFEFIQKFLLKFPTVNPDWLLLGKGKPLRDMGPTPQPQPQQEQIPDLFQTQDEPRPYSTSDSDDDFQDGTEPETEEPRKTVRRITLFYSDGTFQEFYPPK